YYISRQRYDLAEKETRKRTSGVPSKSILTSEYTKHEHRNYRFHFLAVDAYARHKQLVNNYILYYPGATKLFQRDTSKDKTDINVIHENHRFLWSDTDEDDKNWAKTLAKKYWDKLFKEYCISDLSCYKENKVMFLLFM
ncbi:protein FRA10AC1-like, partial [Anneissia japonica]|uniref:protein FRA10AC1-like n=1 Tax=Anneissia japonica TaxID=1529436 RepID=UPI001425A5A1